jgi:hypothetical protein
MRRTLLVALALFAGAVFADTAPITGSLSWDYDQADESRIDGYRLYDGATLVHEIADPTARQVSFADAGLDAGTYVLTLTAYNAIDESVPSNPLDATIVDGAPPAPTLFRIEITIE